MSFRDLRAGLNKTIRIDMAQVAQHTVRIDRCQIVLIWVGGMRQLPGQHEAGNQQYRDQGTANHF